LRRRSPLDHQVDVAPVFLGVAGNDLRDPGAPPARPEFVRQLDEATDDRDRAADWLRDMQARGEFRHDVDFVDIGRFATMLLNGIALRVAGGDPIDVEPIIRLLRDAIAPR
jgi:hypothetical protein